MPAASHALPRITLGLCTYNRGGRILDTLDAILHMDRAGGRFSGLIVVDNNSTDDTARHVDAFAAAHPQLPIRRVVETVQGSSAARARFVREAADPYLGFLDDDCLPDPDWALAMLDTLDSHPDAGWVGGRIDLAFESGPSRLALRCRTMLAHQDLGDAELNLDRADQGLASAAFAARRDAILAIGWLDHRLFAGREGTALDGGEDYEMCIRLRLAGWTVRYTPRARIRHLIPAHRQTIDYLERLARGVSLTKAPLKWLAAGHPGAPWAERHLDRARMRLARSRLLEWRPAIRRLKLAEHTARVEGWERLLTTLRARAGEQAQPALAAATAPVHAEAPR